MFNIIGSIGDIIKKGIDIYQSSKTPTPQQTVQNITKNVTPQATEIPKTPQQIIKNVTKGVTPQATVVPTTVQSYGLNEILNKQPTYNQTIAPITPQNQTIVPQSELNRSRIESSKVTDTLATPDHYINTYVPELFKADYSNTKFDSSTVLGKAINTVSETGATLLDIIDTGISTVTGATNDFSKRFVDMLDNFDANNPAPLSKKVSSVISTGTGAAGLIPSWLAFSTILNSIKRDPYVGSTIAKAVEYPIEKISELGSKGGGGLVDILPIPQSAKDEIKPAVEELSGLMSIILAGHATPKVIKKTNELRKTVQDKIVTTYQESTPAQRQGGYIKFGKTIEKNIDKLPEDLRNRIEVNAYEEYEFKNNPLNKLTKYESKQYPGELPEVTGDKGKGIYNQKGDQIYSELLPYKENIKDDFIAEDVNSMYSKFITRKREFEKEQIALKKEALDYLRNLKTKEGPKTAVESFTIGDAIKNPTKYTIKEPTYVEPKVKSKDVKTFVEGKPKEKIVAKEETLLKNRIRAEASAARDAAVATRQQMRKVFSDKTKSVQDMKDVMVDYIKKELPVDERGRFLKRVADLDTPMKFNKTFDSVSEAVRTYNSLKEQSTKLGSLRSKQSFLTKIGEFANVTIRDMKKKLGLEGIPIRKMTESQLNAMIEESKVRLDFKREKNLLEGESKPKIETPESEYKAIAEKYDKMTFRQRLANKIREKKERATKAISSGTRRTLQPIADTLENIDKALAYKFQKSKRQTLEKVATRQENISKFADTYQKSKMSAGDKRVYKKAWVDNDIRKLDELNKKYNIEGFDKLRETYDEIINDRNSISDEKSKVNRRDDYFNRVVTDSDGLGKWLVENADVDFTKVGYLGQKYRERATKLGRELTKQEKSKLLSNLLMTNQLDIVSMAKNGNFKKRLLDKIPDELLDYYADPIDSLRIYIQKATEEIEMRKMFLGEKMESAADFDIPVSDLILGNGISEVANGKLSLDKLKKLQEVVKAEYGQHGSTNWFNQKASDSTTIAVMGSPTSAIKNLADIYSQMVEEGIPSVLQAAKRKLTGKTELDLVKMGIDDKPVMDITSGSFSGKMVKELYKWSGFTMTEGFNKAVSLESAVIKARKQANKIKDVDSFVDKYGDLSKYEPMLGHNFMNKMVNIFGDNPKLIKDAIKELQSGQVGELTKDIAFKRAGNRTVLTSLDKPISYLENPNARILYKLKTYQIKITNNQIKNGWKLLGSKNPKTRALGVAYLFRTAAVGTIFNATINTIIDIMMGKDVDISDELFTGALQTLIPINRYGLGTIATKGVWEFIEDTIAPPLSWTNNVSRDIGSIYQSLIGDKEWKGFSKLKSIQNIPFVGKTYYNWLGAGVESKEYQAKQKATEKKKEGMSKAEKIIERENKKEKAKKSKVDLLIEKEKASGDEINW